tara:strand:+ start:1080 stop:1706 length:627 start_codon:yes stop_codon:yes gene_type:complete
MKFIIILLLIFFCILKFKKEKFHPINRNSLFKTNNTIVDENDFVNCCKVDLKFDYDKNDFAYKFKKLDKCSQDDFHNSINHNLFVEGIDNWTNDMCKEPVCKKDVILGSCKNVNFTCKDFVTKENCEKFGLEWFPETCRRPYNKPLKTKYYDIEKDTKKPNEFKIDFDQLEDSSPNIFNNLGYEIEQDSSIDINSNFDGINFKGMLNN